MADDVLMDLKAALRAAREAALVVVTEETALAGMLEGATDAIAGHCNWTGSSMGLNKDYHAAYQVGYTAAEAFSKLNSGAKCPHCGEDLTDD